jgi:hypothetical protein
MLRLVITSIICMLVSFGTISRSHRANNFLNHLTDKHASLLHSDHAHHHHEHSHKHEKSSNEKDKGHTHHLDLSLVSQAIHIERLSYDDIAPPLVFIGVFIPLADVPLLLSDFSFSIFRPPIA